MAVPESKQSFRYKTKFIFSIFLWSLFIQWTMDVLVANFQQLLNPKPSTNLESKFQDTLEYPLVTICNLALNVELSHIHCSKQSKDTYNILWCQSTEMQHDVLNKDYLNQVNKNGNVQLGNTLNHGVFIGSNKSQLKNNINSTKSNNDNKNNQTNTNANLILNQIQPDNSSSTLNPPSTSPENLLNTQNCLVQNQSDRYVSKYSQNSDLLLIAVSINISDYPDESRFSGVTVQLHDRHVNQQTTSGIMVSPGQPVVFRLKKTRQQQLDGTSQNSWEANLSQIGTNNFKDQFGHVEDTVVIGINFHDHHVLEITEMNPYTFFSFFAEIGGILGLLLGYSMNNLIDFIFEMQDNGLETNRDKSLNYNEKFKDNHLQNGLELSNQDDIGEKNTKNTNKLE